MMSDDGLLQIAVIDDGLRLSGEIDASSSSTLASWLDPLPGTDRLALDLAGVAFLDSSGLRVLIDAHRRAEAAGRRLVIVNPSAVVQRLFEISGLTGYLVVE